MARNVSQRTGGRRKQSQSTALDVFINCPFDAGYAEIFNAIVFTVVRSGYWARCALEVDNAGEIRLTKIIKIIGECPFGIHDISCTEIAGDPPLPRFNMPLELGLWLGAHHLGRPDQTGKHCIVFDREQYRYQRFISDIAGQDIKPHNGRVSTLIAVLANWLRHLPGGIHAGGGQSILREYETFQSILPALCKQKSMTPEELQFADFNLMASQYVVSLREEPITVVDIPAKIA